MRYIIGISAFYHDSSASLVKNGEILSAVQEERFTRIKNDNSFPFNSIKYILEENNLSLKQVEAIVFYEKPFLKFERILETYVSCSIWFQIILCIFANLDKRKVISKKNHI